MMTEEMESWQRIERSIQKRFRKELWTPFITAVKQYGLIAEGDRIAVCISGGKDSMLMAKLMQMLERISEVPFEVRYLCMDPGYQADHRRQIAENAKLMNIPIEIFQNRLFEVAEKEGGGSPCYLCARMRRGALYARAREAGCNKIALGHHMNDVIETTVMAMFYASQLQGMMPKIRSRNFEGMELIRPLYRIQEADINGWKRYNDLTFLNCACRFTESIEKSANGIGESKRKEIKELIREMKKNNPDIEKSLFNSVHAVSIDTFPGWKIGTEKHPFQEWYDTGGAKAAFGANRLAHENMRESESGKESQVLIEDIEERISGGNGEHRV